ncbi:MAG: hypothetical protein ABSF84_10485 [Acidimicrobiales bacterium]|jgi:hypothetical protein
MTVLGFLISADDNESSMLDGADVARCGTCSRVLEKPAINEGYRPPRDGLGDASYTYDGYLIVSSVLAGELEAHGASVVAIPSAPGYSTVNPIERVAFDAERRKTRFEEFCNECRRYFSIVGAIPAFLAGASAALPDRVVGTDIEFGSGDEQRPLLIVGPALGESLSSRGLSGLHLRSLDERAFR